MIAHSGMCKAKWKSQLFSFFLKNIVRIFANNCDRYDEKGLYRTRGNDRPFCKSDGASGADGYSAISGCTGQLFFRGYSRGPADCEGDRIPAPQRAQGCRIDTGRNRDAESALLHQPGELGDCAQPFCRFLRRLQREGFLLRLNGFFCK